LEIPNDKKIAKKLNQLLYRTFEGTESL